MQYRSLLDKVVVITGASSGIGKLAVEQFLIQGAKVVLAARSEEAMQAHLRKLLVDKSRGIVVKTDVSNDDEVKQLAKKANAHFGRIDIWVNNAAISLYGTVDQMEPDEIRRLLEVNLLGTIHGTQAALEIFKNQTYGNIINISSVLGKSATPLQSAYVASKHGIVGFTNALREELMVRPYKGIDVSVILPSSMDTPLFLHSRSKLGRMPKPIPPVYDPQITVDAILRCAINPQPEVVVGGGGKALIWGSRWLPRLTERYMSKNGIRNQISNQVHSVDAPSNLYAPMETPESHNIQGIYGTTGQHLKEYAKKHPIRVAIGLAAPVLLIAGFNLLRWRLAKPAEMAV